MTEDGKGEHGEELRDDELAVVAGGALPEGAKKDRKRIRAELKLLTH